jgi:hypothetical protein
MFGDVMNNGKMSWKLRADRCIRDAVWWHGTHMVYEAPQMIDQPMYLLEAAELAAENGSVDYFRMNPFLRRIKQINLFSPNIRGSKFEEVAKKNREKINARISELEQLVSEKKLNELERVIWCKDEFEEVRWKAIEGFLKLLVEGKDYAELMRLASKKEQRKDQEKLDVEVVIRRRIREQATELLERRFACNENNWFPRKLMRPPRKLKNLLGVGRKTPRKVIQR